MTETIEEKEGNESYMQVAIRIKPLDENKKACLQYITESNQIVINKEHNSGSSKRTFSFDYIFGPSTTQETIYNKLCPSLINNFLDGINITVFAYGQTGTGKTYTMGSETSSLNSKESVGIIPRVIQGVYNGIENKKTELNEMEYVVKIMFIEIYQEQLRDLLHPDTPSKDINIWENNNTITISGIQEEVVNNLDEILKFIEKGTVSRMTGTTNVHLHSSRSHAIFTIILEQYLKSQCKKEDSFEFNSNTQNTLIRKSKFHLVDLAGSERVKKTGAEGVRFKESVKINSGLLSLGNVISSLSMDFNNNSNNNNTSNNNNEKHIPYRDSKLTRLLQDSLGGNSKTIMIACISPAFENYDESLNTLKYAQRARKIKNKPIINNINLQALKILTMKQKIEELESKLDQSILENNKPNSNININEEYSDEEWLEFFINEFKNRTTKGSNAIKELNDLKEENDKILKELNEIKEENDLREKNKEKIKEENINLIKEIETLNYRNNEMIGDLNNISYYSNMIANNILLSAEQRDHFNAIVSKWIDFENNNNILLNSKNTNCYEFNEPIIVPPNTAQSIENDNKNNTQDLQAIENQKIRIKKLEDETEKNNYILDQYKHDIDHLQEKLTKTSKSIELNDQKIKKLEKINEELEIENKSLKDENNKLQDRIYSVETTIINSPEKKEEKINNSSKDQLIKEGNKDIDELEEFPQKEGIMLELDMAIKAKVELTRELTKINKEFEKSKHYMSNEIQKLERELENTKGELVKVQNQNQDKDTQRDKLKEEYEKKLKIFENQLIKSRSGQKGYDKIKKENSLFERKNQTLQSEIEKMTSQLNIFKKKTKDDSEKLIEVETRKAKEISVLQKQIEDNSKQLRQKEVKIEMLRKKLDRKIEENNTLSKKLKDNMTIYDNINGNSKKVLKRKNSRILNEDNSNNNKRKDEANINDSNKIIDDTTKNNKSDCETSKDIKNQERIQNNIKKSKIAKINMNKVRLSNTLNYTIREIKRRIIVLNDTLSEKNEELNNLTENEKEENKVCSFIIESLNKEKQLLIKQLEQIEKKNNVTFKTVEIQTELVQEDKINNTYHEVFDENKKDEYENYIETLENERFQLNERLNNIISDHNKEINELKELYEQKLNTIQNNLNEERGTFINESQTEKDISNKFNKQKYLDKIATLEQDNKFFKEKQKDLKKKLREFVNENNHLIGIVNKEKTKNLKLKSYIQNIINIRKEKDDSNKNINIANDDNELPSINSTKEVIDQSNSYYKIRSQEKFTMSRTTGASQINELNEDNIFSSSNINNSAQNNDDMLINSIEDLSNRSLKASRKSLKSNHSPESTLVPSESEFSSLSNSTSVADLTKVNTQTMNNESFLPVIYLKASENVVKTKKHECDKNIINNNSLENQQDNIINNNEFLPSITTGD